MNAPGEHDDGADGEDFASLFGDAARPIDRGPHRIAPSAPRPSPGASAPRSSPGAATFRWPDPSEPGCAAAEGVSDAQLLALRRGEPAPEERIDLHGARRDAAGALLAKRIESAQIRGLRSILVIHGQGRHSATGEAVLKEAIPGWLTRGATAKRVLAFAPASTKLGGSGATIVLLRRDR